MTKSTDEQIRKKVIKCFADENISDEMDADAFEEENIEYFDTSAVINRMVKLIAQAEKEARINEIQGILEGWVHNLEVKQVLDFPYKPKSDIRVFAYKPII